MKILRLIKQVVSQVGRWIPFPARLQVVLLRFWLTALLKKSPTSTLALYFQMETELINAINTIAIDYGKGVHPKHGLMKYHDFFVERLSPGERVLDVGCGYGAVAYSMATRSGAEITAVDFLEENIVNARRLHEHDRIRYVLADATVWKDDQGFDSVVISNCLEHIEHRVELIRFIQSWAQPKRWMIRVPMFDRDWTVPMKKELRLYAFSDPTHFIEYTEKTFAEEMSQAGMVILERIIRWSEIWAVVAPADK